MNLPQAMLACIAGCILCFVFGASLMHIVNADYRPRPYLELVAYALITTAIASFVATWVLFFVIVWKMFGMLGALT